MVGSITCNVLHMRQFCRFLYCLAWFDTVEFNRLPCPRNEMYDDEVFAIRFHYQLTMFGIRVLIWLSWFFSCSYCISNRYWQNQRSILPNFLLFAWFDTLEFNRLPWSNKEIYDNAVSLVDSAIIWPCLECLYSYGYLDALILILRTK